MLILEWIFWIFLIYVTYFQLIYILFKGKQYNRFFATFINTVIPIIGSVPTYIMACKYEKRIGGVIEKIDAKVLKYVLIGVQLSTVLAMFLPIFSSDGTGISVINLIFGKSMADMEVKSIIFLIYMPLLPIIASVNNYYFSKNNVCNFLSYSFALINVLSMQFINVIMSENEVSATAFFWLCSILGTAVMLISIFLMIKYRDKALFKIEYGEKIEYIKQQKQKADKEELNTPGNAMYKCSRCGKIIPKGTICSCIEKKTLAGADAKNAIDAQKKEATSYCVYCKKPLNEGESCNCQGEGFGIVAHVTDSKTRKCVYCGQVLVGESTCVCEKIMKNSEPAPDVESKESAQPKMYFKSQVEKGNQYVADELAELERKINSQFEQVIENINASSEKQLENSGIN